MLENLVDHCELSLNLKDNDLANNLPRLHFRRLGLQYRQGSLYAMPRRIMEQMTEETTIEDLLKAHEKKLRQPSKEDIESFLRRSRRTIYQPSSTAAVLSAHRSPDSEWTVLVSRNGNAHCFCILWHYMFFVIYIIMYSVCTRVYKVNWYLYGKENGTGFEVKKNHKGLCVYLDKIIELHEVWKLRSTLTFSYFPPKEKFTFKF